MPLEVVGSSMPTNTVHGSKMRSGPGEDTGVGMWAPGVDGVRSFEGVSRPRLVDDEVRSRPRPGVDPRVPYLFLTVAIRLQGYLDRIQTRQIQLAWCLSGYPVISPSISGRYLKAFKASSLLENRTNPQPLERPVSYMRRILKWSTCPKRLKMLVISSCLAWWGKATKRVLQVKQDHTYEYLLSWL